MKLRLADFLREFGINRLIVDRKLVSPEELERVVRFESKRKRKLLVIGEEEDKGRKIIPVIRLIDSRFCLYRVHFERRKCWLEVFRFGNGWFSHFEAEPGSLKEMIDYAQEIWER